MTKRLKLVPRLAMFVLLAGLSGGGAWADKPDWAGQGKPSKGDKERHEGRQPEGRQGAEMRHGFNDDSRRFVNDYYGSQFRKGKCPPGLAKKHNGCMPPGQAKKWARGQPVPRDVRFYDLPKDLRAHLPPPPPEHRYVRVASDILLIAIGTRMVIDAIEDIGR
jgi:Ni/Co efflux regulator RcnB